MTRIDFVAWGKVAKGIFLVVLGFLVSCSTTRPIHLEPPAPQEKALYEQGLKALVKNDYKTAEGKFSSLLDQYPTTRWLPGAYYNLGLAQEGLEKYADAVEKYKKVVEFYQGLETRDAAEAFYRLSICYELLGDDAKVVLALLDLQPHLGFLPKTAAEVEVPSRLAAAYARQGNLDQARVYFSRSEQGLRRLRRASLSADVLSWLPKTFYSMGHTPPVKAEQTPDAFKNSMAALKQSQIWLLRAAEFGERNPWASKASKDLVDAYEAAWAAIDKVPMPDNADKIEAAKQRQDSQKEMAYSLDEAVEQLKFERLPATVKDPEVSPVSDIFKEIGEIEKRLSVLIQARDVVDQLTPEAQSREGLKRPGIIKDKRGRKK